MLERKLRLEKNRDAIKKKQMSQTISLDLDESKAEEDVFRRTGMR